MLTVSSIRAGVSDMASFPWFCNVVLSLMPLFTFMCCFVLMFFVDVWRFCPAFDSRQLLYSIKPDYVISSA